MTYRISSPVIRTMITLSTFLICAPMVTMAQSVPGCGDLDNPFGPFDYTNPIHVSQNLAKVEKAHFTTDVEALRGHMKCGGDRCNLWNDIDYTLRAFPNHHRALMAMARYHLQGFDEMQSMRYSADCYFKRAIQFRPSDGSVYMVYGYYLSKSGNKKKGLAQYEEAVRLLPNSPEAHYNLGLMYFEMQDYVRAREHAQKAYEAGFPLPGLRRKLERVGEWLDSAEQTSESR